MTLTAYLSLALNGAQVTGSSRAKEREGQIVVYGMRHDLVTTRDADGHPVGPAKHRVLIVQKDIDRASPILHRAFDTAVPFSTFELEFQRMPPAGGPRESYFKVALKNPAIAWIRQAMPFLRKPEFEPLPEFEEVAFVYEEITWSYSGAGDGSGSGNTLFTEAKVDMSPDEPHWSVQLETMLKDKLKTGAAAAGTALQDAFKELIELKLDGKLPSRQGGDK